MNTAIKTSIIAGALALGSLAVSGTAMAAHVNIGVNLGVPAPVYVAPQPVYAPPPPPVVYAPPPPPVYAAAPVLVIGWHGNQYWDGRRYWNHDDYYRYHGHDHYDHHDHHDDHHGHY